MELDELISANVTAMGVASELIRLTYHLTKAEDDTTGVYGDACREDLEMIDAALAKIKTKVALLPKRRDAA